MNGLVVSTVSGRIVPDSLIEDWWTLWHRSPEATPFQSPAWLVPWWKSFSPGELAIICVRRGTELVGLAPFYIEDTARSKRALPIGIAISDYLDVLLDPSCWEIAGAALIEAIAERAEELTSWEFTELAPWSAALRLDAPLHCTDDRDVCNVCPTLPIPWRATSLKQFLPTHRLQTVRTAWNRMRRADAPEVVLGDAANADELFAALVSLHAARWQHLETGGVLTDSRVLRFHHVAIPALAAADLLRLFALRYRDQYIAVHYGFHHRSRSYAYLVGFDTAHETLSPGSVLFAHAIETALNEGATEFDFLRGGESYKYLWGARDRSNQRRVLRCSRIQFERRIANERH